MVKWVQNGLEPLYLRFQIDVWDILKLCYNTLLWKHSMSKLHGCNYSIQKSNFVSMLSIQWHWYTPKWIRNMNIISKVRYIEQWAWHFQTNMLCESKLKMTNHVVVEERMHSPENLLYRRQMRSTIPPYSTISLKLGPLFITFYLQLWYWHVKFNVEPKPKWMKL